MRAGLSVLNIPLQSFLMSRSDARKKKGTLRCMQQAQILQKADRAAAWSGTAVCVVAKKFFSAVHFRGLRCSVHPLASLRY